MARIRLQAGEREQLEQIAHGGRARARVVVRALTLLGLARGEREQDIARHLGVCERTVRTRRAGYEAGGLRRALYDEPRSGRRRRIGAAQRQRIVALACSAPPAGQARWSLRRLAQEAHRRRWAGQVGREAVRRILQEHDLQPWREKKLVRGPAGWRLHPAHGRAAAAL